MKNLRKLARGRPCMVRLHCCNGEADTTVLAHVRLIGISGLGIKAPDLLACWACSACHAYADSHHDVDTQCAFYEGVLRTQAQLIREEVVSW